MPELGPYGLVRGARGNSRPYRDPGSSGDMQACQHHVHLTSDHRHWMAIPAASSMAATGSGPLATLAENPQNPHYSPTGCGVPGNCSAEITPTEPVWVIPAKGAAWSERRHPIRQSASGRASPLSAPAWSGSALPGAWPRAPMSRCSTAARPGRREPRRGRHAGGVLRGRPGEEALVALGRDSQARWPDFADELLARSGVDVELRREGTLVLALTADDQATLAHHLDYQQARPAAGMASAAATRAKEPHLAGKIAGAVFSPEDHQVDNRKLCAALRSPRRRPARKCTRSAVKEISVHGRATGVVLEDGTTSRPIASCSLPAPGRAPSAGCRPTAGRRCAR